MGQGHGFGSLSTDDGSRGTDEDLRRQRELYRAIIDNIPVMLVIFDPRLRRFELNREAERLLGWTSADANDGDFLARVYPDPDYRQRVAAYMQTLEPGWREWDVTAKDGSVVTSRWANVRLSDDTSIGIGLDVRPQKRAERELAESEQRWRTLAEATFEGVAITDEGRYQDVNEQLCRMLGWTRAELLGREVAETIAPEDRDAVLANIRAGRAAAVEHGMVRRDGTRRTVEAHGQTIAYHGRPVRVTAIRDITERKTDEARLREWSATLERRVAERTAALERHARALRALATELTQTEQRERRRLATVLHDHLQQLLVAAKLHVGLAARHASPGTGAAAGRQADELLDQAIHLSRSLTTELSPPVLHDAGLSAGLEWLARWMQSKHGLAVELELAAEAEPEEDLRVFLFESVRELLFNVVKHAGVASATVRTAVHPDHLEVSVEDRGRGCAPDATRSGGAPGFGLFSIQQRLEYLGGTFELRVGVGDGCRVRLCVPRPGRADAVSAEGAEPPPGTGEGAGEAGPARGRVRVLLADDHEILREGLRAILAGERDIEVVGEAADGAGALESARRLAPDVVVMDVSMPVLNGIEATRAIRAELPGVRVVGLSMHLEQDVAREMRAAGADAFLTKGGPADELVDAIRQAVRATAAAEERA